MESHSKDIEIVKNHIKSWKNVAEKDFEFERLAGLSNLIWKVSIPKGDIKPNAVVYRQFGTGCELVDRDQENYIFSELSNSKVGPRCFGFSTEYRIEEFCEGEAVTDSQTRVPEVRRKLARRLAILHSLKLKSVDDKPYFLKNIQDGIYVKDFENKVKTAKFEDFEKKIIDDIKKKLMSESEIDFLQSLLPQNPEAIVFSHNDLHSGNMLHVSEEDKYLLIDFEYSAMNYRAVDIANLFIEANLDYTYGDHPYYKVLDGEYPSKSDLEDFVRYYSFFTLFGKNIPEEESDKFMKDPNALIQHATKYHKLSALEKMIDQVLQECKVGKLLSHYHWVFWSVAFSKSEEIKFDYISYAKDRLRLYEEAKKELSSAISFD